MSEQSLPTMYCYKHPDRETLLRCNKCEQPICPSCAVLTPTGYRCKDCISGQQKVYDTAKTRDYLLAIPIAAILGLVGSLSAEMGFFVIFLAPIVGVIIAETVRWAVRRRRSRLLSQLTTVAAAVGSLPPVIIYLLGLLLAGSGLEGLSVTSVIMPLIWQSLYTVLVSSSTYYRLHGIRVSG